MKNIIENNDKYNSLKVQDKIINKILLGNKDK